jgi:multicomponent Na+:H+ antiporter subunit D
MWFPPLPVVIPLIVAASLVAIGAYLPRRVLDLVACVTAASVFAICCHLVAASADQPIVYWFGGWRPEHRFALGICFVIDQAGAGLAALASLLVLAAFVFSWHYFESIKSLYHALMLVFLAGMCGMCLTGDLFNLFVWFELMSASGVALCGYKSEEFGPLQGALNFAILNTLGAYLSLTGVAIVYASVGALNFAQASASLAAHDPGGWLVPIAFLFVISGFLVKAAAFPFHFWLADAHAVAPTPVCILFSGVMVELGLYAAARVYWSVFAIPLAAHSSVAGALFLTIGTLTVIVGGIECFSQRHLKRLLAFSTISHTGVMFLGVGLLSADGLGGTAVYLLGHGLVKGGLFICAGILLHRFRSVDEFELHGKGRELPWTGLLLLLGALGLAGMPPFATFFGEGQLADSARRHGLGWVSGVMMLSGILTSAAVLRIGGRIFLGWGLRRPFDSDEAPAIPMESETQGGHRNTPGTMLVPALALIACAMAVALAPSVRIAALRAAHRMEDTRGVTDHVLLGTPMAAVPEVHSAPALGELWKPAVNVACAALLALAALFPRALGRARRAVVHAIERAIHPLRAMHTGRVGDYVAWFILGVGVYGAMLVFGYRR